MIAIILDEEEQSQKQKQTHIIWIIPIWENQSSEGEFTTLYKSLIDNEIKFQGCFSKSMYLFDILLKTIQRNILERPRFEVNVFHLYNVKLYVWSK